MDKRETSMKAMQMSIPVCDKIITTEITCDYVLPDYLPEAKKILYTKTNLSQPAKYVSSASAEFNGKVEYIVFYVGADGELYSVPITSEYEIEGPIDNTHVPSADTALQASVNICVENAVARLTGPRKINVRSKLKSYVNAYCNCSADCLYTYEANDNSVEYLENTVSLISLLYAVSDAIEISEEIIPDSEVSRIVCADGKVFINELICEYNKINVKGDLYLSLLTSASDIAGITKNVQRRIPINADIELEGLTPEGKATVYGAVNDVSVNILDGRIVCDMSVVFIANAQTPQTITCVEDMYSTCNDCDVSYKAYPSVKNGYCFNGNFSMNERLNKENIFYPQNADIVDVFGVAFADNFDLHENKTTVNGQVKYTLLLTSDGEYTTNEIILPFRYEFENDAENITTNYASISVINCKARHDAESVSIDAELSVSAWGMAYDEITVASEVNFGEQIKKNKGELVIYYLRPDDTSWSVAKKYRISRKELESKNEMIEHKDYMII